MDRFLELAGWALIWFSIGVIIHGPTFVRIGNPYNWGGSNEK